MFWVYNRVCKRLGSGVLFLPQTILCPPLPGLGFPVCPLVARVGTALGSVGRLGAEPARVGLESDPSVTVLDLRGWMTGEHSVMRAHRGIRPRLEKE